jgi:hypothetical protein
VELQQCRWWWVTVRAPPSHRMAAPIELGFGGGFRGIHRQSAKRRWWAATKRPCRTMVGHVASIVRSRTTRCILGLSKQERNALIQTCHRPWPVQRRRSATERWTVGTTTSSSDSVKLELEGVSGRRQHPQLWVGDGRGQTLGGVRILSRSQVTVNGSPSALLCSLSNFFLSS